MTQEQLAEALGVTFAAVSKWERGVTTPEPCYIVEMADLFETSVDALLGYQYRNNNRKKHHRAAQGVSTWRLAGSPGRRGKGLEKISQRF